MGPGLSDVHSPVDERDGHPAKIICQKTQNIFYICLLMIVKLLNVKVMHYIKIIILLVGLLFSSMNIYGNNHNDYLSRGNIYLMELDIDRAIHSYTKAIEDNQNAVEAYLQRAKAYLLMDACDKAADDYKKAFELDPEYVKKRLNISFYTPRNDFGQDPYTTGNKWTD
jgi:tetratricopeptide (TPR) repeat protein